jgi:hypothetical protein
MAVRNDRAIGAVSFERLLKEFAPTLCALVRDPLI